MTDLVSRKPREIDSCFSLSCINIDSRPERVKKNLGMPKLYVMTVRFRLTMKDAWIGDELVDFFELQWLETLSPRQLASRFNAWLGDQTFIRRHIPDLKEATYCQLFIDPLQ